MECPLSPPAISTLSKCLCHKICGAWMRFRSMTRTTWSPVTLLGESNPICSSRHETHAQWWTIAHHKSLAAIELGHRNACDTRTPTHLTTQFLDHRRDTA